MKKVLLMLIVLLSVSGLAFAESTAPLAPYIGKGAFTADAAIGYGGIVVGAEDQFLQFDLGGKVPLTIGAGARVLVDPGITYADSSMTFAGGVMATVHVEATGLPVPEWLKHVDLGFDLGVGFGSATPSST